MQSSAHLAEIARLERINATGTEKLATLEHEIGQAKYRLSLKEEVDAAMLSLQERNHQRMVGMYENLLTEINREVIGGDKEVKLELSTHGGRPSMDIYMENDGNPESILNGTGGAVSNVISVGLRFIALSRIKRRKFIVLDEADCWIASERIPFFANIIAKMGQELGFQVLMISHHPQSFFYEAANTIVQFTRGDNSVRTTVIKQAPDEDRVNQIASVHLLNFMSHSDSTIPFGTGMTLLQAENDIGKSAVGTALDAITSGGFKKEYIRHGSEHSEVTLTFTDGQSLVCRRVAKTNRNDKYSISYRLYDKNGALVHEAPVKDELPVWAVELMGISPEQDLDIQIGNQKTPVFLLQEAPAKRAAILSIGGEISHIAAMQTTYKERVAVDKKVVAGGEPEVGRLRKLLSATEGVGELRSKLERLTAEGKAIDDRKAMIASMTGTIETMSRYERITNIRMPAVPAFPVITDLSGMESLLKRLQCNIPVMPTVPVWPSLVDTSPMEALLKRLEISIPLMPSIPQFPEIVDLTEIDRLRERVKGKDIPPLPNMPNFPELTSSADFIAMNELIYRLGQIKTQGKEALQKMQDVALERDDCALEINELIDEAGGICGACGSTMEKMDIHQHENESGHAEHSPGM